MNAEQINGYMRLRIKHLRKRKSDDLVEVAFWEIAYQLAVLNEQIGKGRLTPIVITAQKDAA